MSMNIVGIYFIHRRRIFRKFNLHFRLGYQRYSTVNLGELSGTHYVKGSIPYPSSVSNREESRIISLNSQESTSSLTRNPL